MCSNSLISVIITLYFSLDFTHQYRLDVEELPDYSWDILILTQHWPVTKCIFWMQKAYQHCVFPKNKDQWTLHGIWPMKLGADGPYNCNDSWVFDPELIKPIETELEQAWTNIYKESSRYSLWEHEWIKHGPCGASIKLLNTQLKYFSKGIEWNKQYSLSDILETANILPSDTRELTVKELGNAVKSKTGKLPTIACFTLGDVQYLKELRICFDKQQNLVDCEMLVEDTCNVSKGIIYPRNPTQPSPI